MSVARITVELGWSRRMLLALVLGHINFCGRVSMPFSGGLKVPGLTRQKKGV